MQMAGGEHRFWLIQQIMNCLNFVFKANWPICRLFERACELSLYLLCADRIGQLFGKTVRRGVKGKLTAIP